MRITTIWQPRRKSIRVFEDVLGQPMARRIRAEPPVAVPTGRGILFRAYERRNANKRWVLKAIHSVLSIMSTNEGVVDYADDLPLHDADPPY